MRFHKLISAAATIAAIGFAGVANAQVNLLNANFATNNGSFASSGTPAWTYATPSWTNPGQSVVGSGFLTSPTINITTTGLVSVSFLHNFNLESNFDGGQIQFSINGGAFSTRADSAFTAGAPTSTISANFSSPIAGQRAWSGLQAADITSSLGLGTLTAGNTLVLRFLVASDSSVVNASPNWTLKSVLVQGAAAAAAPEPASLALVALGGLAVAGIARRRRS